ncbi:MAG: GHKL domain-containing protein [Bacilli bacterium]|nr:GHKL domain-containing protein [Bacilli bacterium]
MIEILSWIFICFASTFGYVYFYYKLVCNNEKISLKTKIIFLIGFIVVTLLEYNDLNYITTILFFIYFPILFKSIKIVSFRKIVAYLVIIWLYAMFLDFSAMLIISLLHYFYNVNVHSDFFVMFPTIFVFVSLLIISNSRTFCNFTNKLIVLLCKIKYYDFLLISFTLFVLIIAIVIALNVKSLNLNILLALILILSIAIFILLIRSKIKDVENSIFLKTLQENNDFYIKVEDENRIFKHNLVAKLLSIKSVSNNKSMALIEDLILQFNKNVSFSQTIKVIPYGLNGIIYQKLYSYMNVLNIKINNEIGYDIFSVLKPRRYNVFVEKIVIALDNAIEHCLKSNDKIIFINLYEDNNCVIVEIKNTFSESIDVDLVGNKGYSTKGKLRGLGIFSALRDNEASLNVKIYNNLFINTITAKKFILE